jgi:poly(A) polymerase
MVEPHVVSRSGHSLSRSDIDPDALKVLYRLHHHRYTAYLVGGSVRDLLLGRRPKDFDIGTSAHPYEVKRLFKNCWVIGRRFRLAHVKFGSKIIEVATFRRQVPSISVLPAPGPGGPQPPDVSDERPDDSGRNGGDLLIHRDNTFGTPEEDAFRRDFTVNALFYDIATFSIIDYVGGLDDLDARVIRSIGHAGERFAEDPVRMIRAIALASRLDFRLDPEVEEAIRRHRADITRSAAPRLYEEYLKILRGGAAERTFRSLAGAGLLEYISPEIERRGSDLLWRSLAALDAFRRRTGDVPETLTNPILLGTLLVPLGFSDRRVRDEHAAERQISLGNLPLPRRDLEQLRQVLGLQHRLRDLHASPRAQRALMHRAAFGDALTWLEVHGESPAALAHWREMLAHAQPSTEHRGTLPVRRRRRRRRRRLVPPAS